MKQYSPEQFDYRRPTSFHLSDGWTGSVAIAIAIAVAVVYFLAARLSLFLLTEPDGVAVFWPAAGVSAGTLICLRPAGRLPVLAGTMAATFAANVMGDRNIGSAAVFAFVNAGEAAIVSALIERYFDAPFNLDRPRNVIGLLFAASVATAISGIGGTAGFELFHYSSAPLGTIWHHWFASDALGIITVAPLLIGLAQAVREPPPRSEIFEGVAALTMLTIVSALIVLLPRELWVAVVPTASLFPLVLWVTARCSPVFAGAATFIIALTLVWATTFGIGILGDPSLPIDQRILCAQAGLLTASFCALILAALFAERKSNEASLARTNLMLERERDNKLMNVQAATATMAHEVKQPLAVISLKGEAAQRLLNHAQPDIEKVRSALVSIVDNSHRAGQIVNSTRALLGRTKKGHDSIHVNKLALQVLDLLQEQLKAQGVLVRVELSTGLPLIVGDHSQLQEVVINLLQNAIEAMSAVEKGHKLLRLRTKRHREHSVVVEVEDSGPGIDPAGLNSIFDAFFTTKSQGMGLGLAISRMIIERHGGRLSAASDGTNGALFQVVLPSLRE